MWLDAWPAQSNLDWWDGVRVGADISSPSDHVDLPKNPIQSVDAINVFASDDSSSAWATTNYFVDIHSVPGRIVLKSGGTVPAPTRVANGIEVQFTSGYGDASTDVPNALIEGIKMLIAAMYESRGTCADKAASSCGAYNVWRQFVIMGV
ncbi:MAG: hypothetical protein JRL30_28475 [Deltaproteobacteria bacterium]|nr:hypothetical protein [Deltaproteobacteria bacterium]